MDLRTTQLKDTYGNLVTTGTTAGNPTSGGLQNGQGTLLTAVGIGTNTTTNAKLKVSSNFAGGSIMSEDTNSTTSFVRILGDASNENLLNWQHNTDLRFATSNQDYTSFAERMRIDSSGNVGIGVTPNSKLDIVDSSNPDNTSGSVIIEGRRDGVANVLTLRAKDASAPTSALPNGQGSVLRWQGFDGTDFENMGYILVSADGQAVANGDAPSFMAFGTSADSSSNPTERMRIKSTGDISFRDGATNEAFYWDASEARLGLGTTSPNETLSLYNSNRPYIQFTSASTGTTSADGFFMGFASSNGDFQIRNKEAQPIDFWTSDQIRMRIDSSGNVLVGTTATPTSSAGNIVLGNGTAPTGNATDGVILYAEDFLTSSELKVRDEAGNVTTLSPHNFSLIPDGASEPMAWAYYSERDGKKINVDMLKLARMVESLTGEKLVYEQ